MTSLQRLFPLKRFGGTFLHLHLKNNVKRSSLWREISFKTRNNDLFTSVLIQKNNPQVVHFCSLMRETQEVEKEIEEVKKVPQRNFNDVDLLNPDLMQTFEELLSTYRILRKALCQEDFDVELRNFVGSDKFINFCNTLELKLPSLSHYDLKTLLLISMFRVPASSPLLQKIIHLIIEKINDFTGVDALMIIEMLSKAVFRGNPKVKVLEVVCKQYFNVKLSENQFHQSDYEKMAKLSNSKAIPLFTRRKLLGVVMRNFNKVEYNVSMDSLSHIFGSFTDTSLLGYFKPDLLKVLREKYDGNLNFQSLNNILLGCRSLYLNGRWSENDLLDRIVQSVKCERYGLYDMLDICEKLFCMDYRCFPIAREVEKHFTQAQYKLKTHKSAYRVARVLGNHYYHPFGYTGDDEVHKESLKKLDSFDFEMIRVNDYVKWCMCMTVLGSPRKAEYINKLFMYLSEVDVSKELPQSAWENIIVLNAFAKLHFPTEVKELSEKLLEQCHKNLQKPDLAERINKALENFLPPNAQVFHQCTTSLGQLVDTAILLNSEAQPKPARATLTSSNSIKRIEDITRPPSSDLILLQIYLGFHPCEFRNTSELPGFMQLYKDTFEPLNCKVVFLSKVFIQTLNSTAFVNFLVNKTKRVLKQE